MVVIEFILPNQESCRTTVKLIIIEKALSIPSKRMQRKNRMPQKLDALDRAMPREIGSSFHFENGNIASLFYQGKSLLK